jgi:hypothetical protein
LTWDLYGIYLTGILAPASYIGEYHGNVNIIPEAFEESLKNKGQKHNHLE